MKISSCRLCKGKLSEPKLDLGLTPIANEFLKHPHEQELFPLQVCVCEDCGHYQLNEVIDKKIIFPEDYVFMSGTSSANAEYFKEYADEIIKKFKLKSSSKVLDLASNDGTFLKHFKKLGMNILGIDPAKNIANKATEEGIKTVPEFFTNAYADKVLNEYGKFDIITANNVFAHIEDHTDFVNGVKKVLKKDGIFIFEVSYFSDVCNYNLFDTIYLEHQSYHTIKPLINFFNKCKMEVFDIERPCTHGGSIRLYIRNKTIINRLWAYIDYSYVDFFARGEYANISKLKKNIKLLGYELRELLQSINEEGKTIGIWGFPAKATTIFYALDIDEKLIDCVIDDNPLKQNLYTPGKHLKISSPELLETKQPDYMLILAWNFSEQIMKDHPEYKGKWIVIKPEIKII